MYWNFKNSYLLKYVGTGGHWSDGENELRRLQVFNFMAQNISKYGYTYLYTQIFSIRIYLKKIPININISTIVSSKPCRWNWKSELEGSCLLQPVDQLHAQKRYQNIKLNVAKIMKFYIKFLLYHIYSKQLVWDCAGITPYPNLNHYDLPQALEDRYNGWLSRKVV